MEIHLSQLQDLFRVAFDKPDLILKESDSKLTIPEWDSMNHLNLIVELEGKLNVSFSPEEIEKLDSVSNLIKQLQSK